MNFKHLIYFQLCLGKTLNFNWKQHHEGRNKFELHNLLLNDVMIKTKHLMAVLQLSYHVVQKVLQSPAAVVQCDVLRNNPSVS